MIFNLSIVPEVGILDYVKPSIPFKELYHDTIHGITNNNEKINDSEIESHLNSIKNSKSISDSVKEFFSLLSMYREKYICNTEVLQYILSSIGTDKLRSIDLLIKNSIRIDKENKDSIRELERLTSKKIVH